MDRAFARNVWSQGQVIIRLVADFAPLADHSNELDVKLSYDSEAPHRRARSSAAFSDVLHSRVALCIRTVPELGVLLALCLLHPSDFYARPVRTQI